MRFWSDFKFARQAKSLIKEVNSEIKVRRIVSGKLRRYHHVSIWRQLLWFKTVLLNIRDLLFVIIGILQSFVLLVFWRPDVIFLKGGYVCLPVGIASRLLRIKYVIHDSDAHPGLANRILGRWASKIATGAPLENYSYPKGKASYVGIPISDNFTPMTDKQKLATKTEWKLDTKKPLVVVTGGGLGARRINDAIVHELDNILPKASMVLISGSNDYDSLKSLTPTNNKDFQLYPFVGNQMHQLLGMADIVVTRAGATTLHELSALGSTAIIVPNAMLTGGHQLKNAEVYKKNKAAIIISDSDIVSKPQVLSKAIDMLIQHPDEARAMGDRLHKFYRSHAAAEVATLIIDTAHDK